jgi:hypothetical protein
MTARHPGVFGQPQLTFGLRASAWRIPFHEAVGAARSRLGDNPSIRPDAARRAELPELLGGPVVLMNRLVYGEGVHLTSAIPIQLFGDMLEEVGQSRLVGHR